MRNRVALKVARGMRAQLRRLVRVSVVLALVPVALVAGTQVANASAADGVAADGLSFGIAGPVGIAAVVVGFGGLVTGLVRRRRREVAGVPQSALDPQQATERAAGERAV